MSSPCKHHRAESTEVRGIGGICGRIQGGSCVLKKDQLVELQLGDEHAKRGVGSMVGKACPFSDWSRVNCSRYEGAS